MHFAMTPRTLLPFVHTRTRDDPFWSRTSTNLIKRCEVLSKAFLLGGLTLIKSNRKSLLNYELSCFLY